MLLEEIAQSRLIDLGQPLRQGMPQSTTSPPFRLALERRHGDEHRPDGGSGASEMIVTGGHVGTHVDALAHASQDGLLHGGHEAQALQSPQGFTRLGIDAFLPYVGRCVILDVPRVHGLLHLPEGYEITPDDLDAAQRLADAELRPGDGVLVATGWSRLWDDRARFAVAGSPGPGEWAGRWLTERRPRFVGGETLAFERLDVAAGMPLTAASVQLPVHRIMLVESGVNIVEAMRLWPLLDLQVGECAVVMNPLPIVGATGAPVRPLALVG